MDRTFHTARDDLALGMVDVRMVEHARDHERPVLHQSFHGSHLMFSDFTLTRRGSVRFDSSAPTDCRPWADAARARPAASSGRASPRNLPSCASPRETPAMKRWTTAARAVWTIAVSIGVLGCGGSDAHARLARLLDRGAYGEAVAATRAKGREPQLEKALAEVLLEQAAKSADSER